MTLQIGWNLEKISGAGMPQVVKQANWQSVTFNDENKTFVPKKSRGIYIVSVHSDMFKGMKPFKLFETPAYIGMSLDLRKRFENHTAGSQPDALWRRLGNAKRHATFWYAVIADESKITLKEIEQNLIDLYGSPLNRINSVRIMSSITGTSNFKGE
mgnify:CR=1 FL=1